MNSLFWFGLFSVVLVHWMSILTWLHAFSSPHYDQHNGMECFYNGQLLHDSKYWPHIPTLNAHDPPLNGVALQQKLTWKRKERPDITVMHNECIWNKAMWLWIHCDSHHHKTLITSYSWLPNNTIQSSF